MDRIEKRLAVRFGLAPKKRPAPGRGNQKPSAQGKQSVCQGSPKRVKLDDAAEIAASSGSVSDVGPAEETREEHCARHGSQSYKDCARCKFLVAT